MRIKRGFTSHRKHKKVLESVKGYRMTKSRLIKVAKEAALHAGQYAYSGRRHKKSDFRKLWISRINQAVNPTGISYSVFMARMKKSNIILDRKMLGYLVTNDPEVFARIVDTVKSV